MAVFSTPFIHLGTHSGMGATYLLPDAVGQSRAREMLFTGREVRADEAREWGPRTFGNLGLSQHWNATPHWAFDFTVDRSKTLSGDDVVPFDAAAFPVSATQDDRLRVHRIAVCSRHVLGVYP